MNIMLIKELFSDYIADIPNSIGKGELLKVRGSEKAGTLEVFASFEQVQKYEYVQDFENVMRKNLNINSFTLHCRYSPALFSSKCLPDIISMLRKKIYVINGHFDNAEYSLEEEFVIIDINGVGYSTLKKANVEAEIEKLIRELY